MKKAYRNIIVLLCLLGAVVTHAQNEQTISLDDAMLSMKKRKLVLEYLDLTEAEKAAFWPLYNEYDKEINPIDSETLTLIELCADPEIDPKDMERYSKRLLLNDLLMAKIRKQYYTRFDAGLSGLRASQFMQFDDSFRMMLRFQKQQESAGPEASVGNGVPILSN